MNRNEIWVMLLTGFFSFGAAVCGFWLTGSADISFVERFAFNFFFIMQALSTIWLLMAWARHSSR